MSDRKSHDRQAATRATVIPFLVSAPVAVACAGVLLLMEGVAPLRDNWSTLTMSLTHIGTLGFLTMLMLAAFYVYAPITLAKRIPAPRLAYLVYGLFAPGVVSLCLGLGGVAVTPVFIAIGTLFPGLIAFFWPAISALRGTRKIPQAIPLRLAVGSFLAASTIGIWVAHGHGGMKFPGPRGLWLQIHLSIALLGWIGGMATAAFDAMARDTHPIPDARRTEFERWWGHLTLVGVVAPCVLLALQYFDVVTPAPGRSAYVAAAAVLPAALAGFWLQPFMGLRALKAMREPIADAALWRGAFALGPIVSIVSVVVLIRPEPHWRIAFGWIALWGWAGLMAHAVLRDLSRRLLAPGAANPAGGFDLGYALHLFTLLVGIMAIEWASVPLARLVGAGLILLAVVQAGRIAADCRSRSAPLP